MLICNDAISSDYMRSAIFGDLRGIWGILGVFGPLIHPIWTSLGKVLHTTSSPHHAWCTTGALPQVVSGCGGSIPQHVVLLTRCVTYHYTMVLLVGLRVVCRNPRIMDNTRFHPYLGVYTYPQPATP